VTDAFTPTPSHDDPARASSTESSTEKSPESSMDAIERDLADVEAALARLDAGTYWTDEVTGQPLSAELLARRPLARRNENS
jgi:RNA polymerase-binding transcription factor DksA